MLTLPRMNHLASIDVREEGIHSMWAIGMSNTNSFYGEKNPEEHGHCRKRSSRRPYEQNKNAQEICKG